MCEAHGTVLMQGHKDPVCVVSEGSSERPDLKAQGKRQQERPAEWVK
jgi:hypothetical protein